MAAEASAIAGLISLADVVIERTFRLIICLKNAHKDAKKLLDASTALVGVLKTLQILSSQVNEKLLLSSIPVNQVYLCQKTLERIKDKLPAADPGNTRNLLSKAGRLVKWPFISSELEELVEEIERHKTTFTLATSADILATLLKMSERQNSFAADVEQIKQSLQRVSITDEKRKALDFFGSFDSEPNHVANLKYHQPGTGLWLIDGIQFQKWLNGDIANLWLFGIPGAGKTVLAAIAIRETIKTASTAEMLTGVAYYYCDYKRPKSRETINILASLVGQLALQNERCLQLLMETYKPTSDGLPRRMLPSEEELEKHIYRMSAYFESVAIVVDALDECDRPDEISETLARLQSHPQSNIKLLVLSRNEVTIKRHLHSFENISIAADSSDLRLYVSTQIEERSRKGDLNITSPGLKDEIMERLINGADGMFRWVACQIDHLCVLPHDKARRKALTELPPDLHSTYNRILERVNEAKEPTRAMVQRVLYWLTSYRLTKEALQEAISFEEGEDCLDLEARTDIEVILLRCSSLVRLSHDEIYIEFAHFTVEEFLRSQSLEKDLHLRRYHCGSAVCNSYIRRTQIAYLSMTDFAAACSTYEELEARDEDHPFFQDAAMFSEFYQGQGEIDENDWVLLEQFFAPISKGNFQSWAQRLIMKEAWSMDYCDDTDEEVMRSFWDDFKLFFGASPFEFACILQIPSLIRRLLQLGADVNLKGLYGHPLHCAMFGTTLMEFPSWKRDTVDLFTTAFKANDLAITSSSVHTLLEYNVDTNVALMINRVSWPTMWLAAQLGLIDVFLKAGTIPDPRTLELVLEDDELDRSVVDSLVQYTPTDRLPEEAHLLFLKIACRATVSKPSILEVLTPGMYPTEVYLDGLFNTCWNDNVQLLEALHLSWKVELKDLREPETNRTLISKAAAEHAEKILRYLVACGCDVGERGQQGGTLLHECFSTECYDCGTASIEFLVEQGVDPSSPNNIGSTALHLAALNGSFDQFKLLSSITASAFLQQDDDGDTILHLVASATSADSTEMYDILQTWVDAEVWSQALGTFSESGLNPIHVAAQYSPAIFLKMYQDCACKELRSKDGRVPLHYAVREFEENMDTIQLLCDSGAANILRADDLSTPLHDFLSHIPVDTTSDATKEAFGKALDLLLSASCDVSDVQSGGTTALHLLCEDFVLEPSMKNRLLLHAIQCVLGKGGDPVRKDDNGRSALSVLLGGLPVDHKKRSDTMAEAIESLIDVVSKQDLEQFRHDSWSILGFSCLYHLHDTTLKLMQLGIDVDFKHADPFNDGADWTSLQVLCAHGCPSDVLEVALEKTADHRVVDIHGYSLLHLSTYHRTPPENELAIVSILLDMGIDINMKDKKGGITALCMATLSGRYSAMKYLLEHGADPSIRDAIDRTALYFACRGGDLKAVKILLEYTETITLVSNVFPFQDTRLHCFIGPLEIAACEGHDKVVEALLEVQEKYEKPSEVSALWVACFSGWSNVAERLISAKFDLNCKDKALGWTPLHHAACRGHLDIVRALLEAGCDENVTDNKGLTPMYYAVARQHGPVIALLRKWTDEPHQFDTKILDRHRSGIVRPIQVDAPASSVELFIEKENLEALRLLRGRGWEVDAPMKCGTCTPLLDALILGLPKIASYLLDEGATLSAVCCAKQGGKVFTPAVLAASKPELMPILIRILNMQAGRDVLRRIDQSGSLLHHAALAGNFDAVELLLSRGASCHSSDAEHRRPIHSAAIAGCVRSIEFLVENGADVNSQDVRGRVPSYFAAEEGHLDAIQTLHMVGADLGQPSASMQTALHRACFNRHFETAIYIISQGYSIANIYQTTNLPSPFEALLTSPSAAARTYAFNSPYVLDDPFTLYKGTSEHSSRHTIGVVRRYCKNKLLHDINDAIKRLGRVRTPLYDYVRWDDPEPLHILIEAGALINLEGGPEGTPLMTACALGRLQFVKSLIRLGAIECYEKNGQIVSAFKAARHFPEIIRWLLVERYTEQKRIQFEDSGLPIAESTCTAITTIQDQLKTVKLDLNLIFDDEREDYLKQIDATPRTERVILCHHNEQECQIEIPTKNEDKAACVIPENRRYAPRSVVRTAVPHGPRSEARTTLRSFDLELSRKDNSFEAECIRKSYNSTSQDTLKPLQIRDGKMHRRSFQKE